MTPSAPAAYRADIVGRHNPFGDDDGGWVAVSTVVGHATLVPEPARGDLLRDAIELSADIVGERELERIANRDWGNRDRAPTDAILVLAGRMEQAGAVNLAAATLDGLLAATALNPVQQGRIIAKRARVAGKMGFLDEMFDRYTRVEQLAEIADSDELRARALIGFGAVAQMRGNYPDLFRYCQRAAPMADRTGIRELARAAHNGLMIATGIGRRFDEALNHGWAAYQASRGDPVDEAEVLGNLGQVLLECGHTAPAMAVFAAVVSRTLPARMILAALGGLALASAASDQPDRVEWAASEVCRLEEVLVPRYPLAVALIECATALARIRQVSAAERCRGRALALARAYDFHEVVHRAEALDPLTRSDAGTRPTLLAGGAESVVRELAWLEPERLPEHVALTIASVS